MFVWPAATSTVPASTHLPLTLVLPKDQLQFVAGRLVGGDIMILSHIRVIWHALLACLLLAGSAPQISALSTLPLPHYCQTHQEMVPPFGAHSFVCMYHHIHKNLHTVMRVILSVLMHLLLGVCYLFSSAWFLFAMHYSCFLHTQLAFRLFLMLSFNFPRASLLCLLWAVLWCHVAGPAQLSGPGELGFILSFLITVYRTSNSVELKYFSWPKHNLSSLYYAF